MFFKMKMAEQPDLGKLEAILLQSDPAAMLAFNKQAAELRVSTTLTDQELLAVLRAGDCPVSASQLLRIPSECCGGCGG